MSKKFDAKDMEKHRKEAERSRRVEQGIEIDPEPVYAAIKDTFYREPREERLLTVFEQMIVDLPEDKERRRKMIAVNPRFNFIIVILILANSTLIGVETDNARSDSFEDMMPYLVSEVIFTAIFFVEMLLRLNQLSWDYFADPWNLFDYSLVVLSCTDIVIIVVKSSDTVIRGLAFASTLRVFRMLRVVRSIKGLKLFQGLWVVIRGLLDSARTIIWVGIAAIVFIYCLGVALTTLVGQDVETRARWTEADIYIGTVLKSMMTILQIVTLDNWCEDIARPLMDLTPLSMIVVLPTIIVMTFGLLNIMLGVMVERVTQIAADSKETNAKLLEQTEHALLMSILDEFHESDVDGGGELDFKEFRKLIRTPSLAQKLSLLGVQSDEAESLFELMDVDHSGSVTPTEFLEGLQKVKGVAKGQDVVALICFAQKRGIQAKQFVDRMRFLNEQCDMIQERLSEVGIGLTAEIKSTIKADDRAQHTLEQAKSWKSALRYLDGARQVSYPALTPGFDEDFRDEFDLSLPGSPHS